MEAELKKLADSIAGRLLAEGFTVQRYDAHSTNSVYLKLDYGVCNSIRISDHPGKKHLKYRYNIGPFVKEFKKAKDKYPRLYYRADKSARMIKRIIQDRESKKFKYGDDGYERLMRKNRSERAGSRGFWSEAVLLDGMKKPRPLGSESRGANKNSQV